MLFEEVFFENFLALQGELCISVTFLHSYFYYIGKKLILKELQNKHISWYSKINEQGKNHTENAQLSYINCA